MFLGNRNSGVVKPAQSSVLPLVPAEGLGGGVCLGVLGGMVGAAAAALVLGHQRLQVLPALTQLLTQDLVATHLRPQLLKGEGERKRRGGGAGGRRKRWGKMGEEDDSDKQEMV